MNSDRTTAESAELNWVRSSYSSEEGGECVEVAADTKGFVRVRDSKRVAADGPELVIRPVCWAALVGALRAEDAVAP
ncbi:DUF397 domain-containing protein [Streptomyces sp. NPDC050418]|uniref:DUF397 domain-containing protein n=1 Tax=Streptomyces sp. NPDC050418 TaxID=3365612 RepID=UPI0037A3E0D3